MYSGFHVHVMFLLCFLEAKTYVVANLVACFPLAFFSWAQEPFNMSRISTLATSILVFVSQSGIKALLVWFGDFCLPFFWCACFLLACVFFSFCTFHLVTQCTNDTLGWSGPLGGLQPPALYVWMWPLSFPSSLASWHTLLAGNLSRSTRPSFIVLETKSLCFRKKTEDILVKYLGCLWRVFDKIDFSLYHVIPLIYNSCTLPEACQKIKVGPYFIHLGFAKLFNMFPDCIKAKVFFRQAPEHILVHAKVSTPNYYLLALLVFWGCCKLAHWYIFAFEPPFQEPML